MAQVQSRPYAAEDLSACLAIFDSNVPTYFVQEERAEYCEYLGDIHPELQPHLVLAQNDVIVACGGLIIAPGTSEARLAWGMVDRALHKQRLGTRLTAARLEWARSNPNITQVGLATSQHSSGFYEKFGFCADKITLDGWAVGLDRWDMTLRFE